MGLIGMYIRTDIVYYLRSQHGAINCSFIEGPAEALTPKRFLFEASSVKPEWKVLKDLFQASYHNVCMCCIRVWVCVCASPSVCVTAPLDTGLWNVLRARENTGLPQQLAKRNRLVGGWGAVRRASKRPEKDRTGQVWHTRSQHRIRGGSWKSKRRAWRIRVWKTFTFAPRPLLMWVGCCSGYFVGKSDGECKHSSFCFLSTVTSPFCLEKSIFCPLSCFMPLLQHFAFISEPVIILQPFCNTRYFNLISSVAQKSCCRHFSKCQLSHQKHKLLHSCLGTLRCLPEEL